MEAQERVYLVRAAPGDNHHARAAAVHNLLQNRADARIRHGTLTINRKRRQCAVIIDEQNRLSVAPNTLEKLIDLIPVHLKSQNRFLHRTPTEARRRDASFLT